MSTTKKTSTRTEKSQLNVSAKKGRSTDKASPTIETQLTEKLTAEIPQSQVTEENTSDVFPETESNEATVDEFLDAKEEAIIADILTDFVEQTPVADEVESPINEGVETNPELNNEILHPFTEDTHSEGVEVISDASFTVTEPQTAPVRAKRESSPKPDLGPRFEAAKALVSDLRRQFLEALDEKAALLGVSRIGEAVPILYDHPEIAEINEAIKRVASELDALREQKRKMVSQLTADPDRLEEVNRKIRRLQRERELARIEKKQAYAEFQQISHFEQGVAE